MLKLLLQSATFGIYFRVLVYTILYSGPTWFDVGLPATEQCCFVSYTNYTGVVYNQWTGILAWTYFWFLHRVELILIGYKGIAE